MNVAKALTAAARCRGKMLGGWRRYASRALRRWATLPRTGWLTDDHQSRTGPVRTPSRVARHRGVPAADQLDGADRPGRLDPTGLRNPGHRARRPRTSDAESTGRVASAESVLVPWPAEPMGSRTRRLVRVRVWGNGGDGPSEWSDPAAVETGLLRSTRLDGAADQPRAGRRTPQSTSRRRCSAASSTLRLTSFPPGCTSRHTASMKSSSTDRWSVRTCWPRDGAATGIGCGTTPTTSPSCSSPAPMPSVRPWRRAGTGDCWASRAAYATSTATGSPCSPSWRSATPTAACRP